MNTQIVKKIRVRKSEQSNPNKMYGIGSNSPFTTEHLLAVILYCDWSQLCTAFSRTFRKTHQYQSILAVKQNNTEYAIWSRLLREAVEIYGDNGDDFEIENGRIMYKARGPFFCGMNIVMPIPEFNIRLCAPTSTSKQIEVATRFGGDRGIIIELNNIDHEFSTQLCSFNCSLFSNYTGENEHLFFGGAYRIKITTIRKIKTLENFYMFFKPLYHFHCMVTGTTWDPSLYGISPKLTCDDKDILEKLICKKLFSNFGGNVLQQLTHLKYKNMGYRNVFCEYISDVFDAFTNHQTQIIIDLHEIALFYSEIADLIKLPVEDTNLDHNNLSVVIFKLFKNMRDLIIYSTGGSGPIIKQYRFNILNLLSNVESSMTHWLKITIYTYPGYCWISNQIEGLDKYLSQSNEKYNKFHIDWESTETFDSLESDKFTIIFDP